MPLRAERPIVRIETDSMHTIETRNPENLFGLWSVFSKCAPAIEDGKRYENLAWRLWARETFCCANDSTFPPRWSFENRLPHTDAEVPDLSSSMGSEDSATESAITATTRSTSSIARPNLHRHDSTSSQARGKHTTPIDLEKVVSSIQEKRRIEPLSPLPEHLARPAMANGTRQIEPPKAQETKPCAATKSQPSPARFVPESSSSTVATTGTAASMSTSPPPASEASASTDMSPQSVVHGFNPGSISTSIRSNANVAPTPILKSIPTLQPTRTDAAKKKTAVFTLGGSSDEDTISSFEHSYMRKPSSLTQSLQRSAPMRKTTSFKHEVATRTFDLPSESEGAIETDSEDDYDNAIEEEDSEDDWEDDNDEGPSMNEPVEFKRVESKANLQSRPSLLTRMMHEGDRAQHLQNLASRSSPLIRRSRTSSPNGPSTGNSPQEDSGLMMRPTATRAKPIIMTTSNIHPPALSPRTTRRNMLQTELTQSLRQNLLWERQQKNTVQNAVNKRAQSAVNLPAMRRAMTTNDIRGLNNAPNTGAMPPQPASQQRPSAFRDPAKNNSSFNDYFDQGLQEYHQKGW